MLDMKNECLDCDCELSNNSEAHICSYECTYCAKCAEQTGLYARIVVAIVSNGPNEAKASRSSRVELQHV